MAKGASRGQRSFYGIRAGLGGAFALGLASAVSPLASGVTVTWSNTGEGAWNVGSNWTGGSVPASGDDSRINNGGTAVIDASQDIASLFVILADVSDTSGNLRMTGGKLTTTSDIRAGGNGGSAGGVGVFTQSGGAVLLNGGNVNVGFGNTAVGTYNLSAGSLQVNSGTIIAVGNRGTGTFDQSGGTVYVKGGTNTANGLLNIGRNAAGTTPAPNASGTVRISAGTMAVANVRFGNAAAGGGVNQLSISGSGKLLTNSISVFAGYTGTNTVSFTGGTLTAASVALPLTNNGGTLAPATVDFAAAPADINALAVNPVGTTTLVGDNGYTQGATGVLAIDLAGLTSYDKLDIGAGTNTASALLAGTIAVNLVSGFNPATGSTFDIVAADALTSTAAVTGQTAGGDVFVPSFVTGDDGRQVLRLTVTAVPEPGVLGLATMAGAAMLTRRGRRNP
jgi:hypothetical protein